MGSGSYVYLWSGLAVSPLQGPKSHQLPSSPPRPAPPPPSRTCCLPPASPLDSAPDPPLPRRRGSCRGACRSCQVRSPRPRSIEGSPGGETECGGDAQGSAPSRRLASTITTTTSRWHLSTCSPPAALTAGVLAWYVTSCLCVTLALVEL